MNQMSINNEIRLTLPDGFHLMDSEEKKRIYKNSAVIPEWVAYEPEHRMIFSASWKRMNTLLAALACSMDGAKGLEKRMRFALRDRNYRFGEYFKEKLGDKKVFGFTYRYQGSEGEFLNRSIMVRNGGRIYYLASQLRTEWEKESKPLIDEIWRSLSWNG